MAQKPGNAVSMYSHPPLYADMSAVPRGKASVVEWATGGIRETHARNTSLLYWKTVTSISSTVMQVLFDYAGVFYGPDQITYIHT